jgi:Ulp1 family protease
LDRLKSLKWIFTTLIVCLIVVVLIGTESQRANTLRTSSVSYQPISSFTPDQTARMPLHFTHSISVTDFKTYLANMNLKGSGIGDPPSELKD